MEVRPPYLEAIQSIAGITPGEKQRAIHAIAKQLARIEVAGNYFEDLQIPVPKVPEPLKPLIRVEVAKILHRYEGIIEALKSNDPVVVARAIQAKWFFDGSNTTLVNAHYFRENVFPNISLFARFRVIKSFGNYLKNTSVAADFFDTVDELYGLSQAIPLLPVCDEEFVFDIIIERKIVLSLRQVKLLYRKYPNLVLKYLKFGKAENSNPKNDYRVNIEDYVKFLPEIGVKRLDDFLEIFQLGDLGTKLYKKAGSKFLETRQDLLIEQPAWYSRLISLKKAARKLSAENFSKMYKNLFPANMAEFNWKSLNTVLNYYKPEKERLSLTLNTFRDLYGEDLLDNENLVDYNLIEVLPAAERVKQARLKLENDKDWHFNEPYKSWRCYLPTSESISIIKKEIGKSSDNKKRRDFLKLLVYTCKINDDKDSLLHVLNYIYDRHRNEGNDVFSDTAEFISTTFELETLSSAHWTVLNKYIKFIDMQDISNQKRKCIKKLMDAATYQSMLNDLPFEDHINSYVDLIIEKQFRCSRWCECTNIFIKYQRFEKILLESFLKEIKNRYTFNEEIWVSTESYNLDYLTHLLWDFNERHKFSNGQRNRLTIKDYPWICDKLKTIIFTDDESDDWIFDRRERLELIKKYEPDIYDLWLLELPKFWEFGINVIYDMLRKRPRSVIDNWKECFEEIQQYPRRYQLVTRFINKCRWYQYLSINFLNESLETYKDSLIIPRKMYTIASLADGETYMKIIEPFIPVDEKMDEEEPEAKENYKILNVITSYMSKVNPPVSLDIIAKFCVGDYLHLVIGSVTGVSHRVPVADVLPFIKTLMNRRVSVKKHGIRLLHFVETLDEVYTVSTDLWNTEKHPSIRKVMFERIFKLFCKEADSCSWDLFRMCLEDLNSNDDETVFKNFWRLLKAPEDYLHDCIKIALMKLRSVEKESQDPAPYVKYSGYLLEKIDTRIMDILPESYCQYLIKRYLFNFYSSETHFDIGIKLTIESYLFSSGQHHESRLKFFKIFFENTVQKYWNKPDPKNPQFYRINYMINKFFNNIFSATSERSDVRIFETLLDIFQSALEPCQDIVSYLGLIYSIEFHKSQTTEEFGLMMVKKISELVDILSPVYIIPISDELLTFLETREVHWPKTTSGEILVVCQILANNSGIYCAFTAANMLLKGRLDRDNEKYEPVVQTLYNFNNPGISAILNKRFIGHCDSYNPYDE